MIKSLTGMKAFWVVWIGQLISLISTSMVNFGLTIWAYEETGLATALALVGVFFVVPLIFLSPFAGVIVDRSNRKLMMILSDAGSGIATIFVLILNHKSQILVIPIANSLVCSNAFCLFCAKK